MDLTLFGFHIKILSCNLDDGTSRDRRKDRIRLRCHKLTVLRDKDDVGSACLLKLCACCGIKIEVLVESLLVCVNDREKAHRIVKAGLDVTRTVRCRTVKITNSDRKWLNAAFEVRSDRCAENSELILCRGFNTDDSIRTENIRTQIKRSAATERRYESFIGLDYFFNGFNELFLWIYRYLKTCCGLLTVNHEG